MKKLNELEWREFILSDVFKITSTASSIDKSKLVGKSGSIPYITRTDKNNGYDGFVSKQDDRYHFDNGNVITIGLDTQTVFYQSRPFYTGQNIQIFSNEYINKYSAMFMISLLKKQIKKFGWGSNGATLTRLKKSKILLPTDRIGDPDYRVMEDYMREKEQELIQQYLRHIESRKHFLQEVVSLDEKSWKEFTIKDLFNVVIGENIDGNKIDKFNGKTAYITRKESNNGLDGFVEGNKKLMNSHYPVITVGNETAEPFVQIYPFFTGTKVNILVPNKFMSKHVLFFIANCLRKHKGRFSYSYTMNSTRLKKQSIMLPIDSERKPDYSYMEQYMKNLEVKQLEQYMRYVETKSIS